MKSAQLVALGIVVAILVLAALVFTSSAHVQRLRAEGQFGTTAVTT